MNSEAQIEALAEKRSALKQAIHEENQRPHPDDNLINELKRQKLRLKDQIHELETH